MDVSTAIKYVVVDTSHMISPCLQRSNEIISSRSKGTTRQVVVRSETARERMKHGLMDFRRDLVLSMTTQIVIFPRSEAMMVRT